MLRTILFIALCLLPLKVEATRQTIVTNPPEGALRVGASDGFQPPGISLNGFRIPKTSLETLIFQEGFTNQLNTDETWDVFAVGGGTVNVADGEGILETTGSNQSIILETQVNHPFTHGVSNLWRIRLILSTRTAVVGSTCTWGVFNSSNGYFFRISGNGLEAVIRRKGLETIFSSTTWLNNNQWDFGSNAHSYAIQYLNGNRVVFWFDDIFIATAGSQVGSLVASSNLPSRFENLQTVSETTTTMTFTGLAVLSEGAPFTFDSARRLRVSGGVSEAPEGTIEITRPPGNPRITVGPNSVTDDFFTITAGKTLVIQVLDGNAVSAGTGKSVIIELFDDTNGDASVLVPIPGGILMGNNFNAERVIDKSFSGDGVRRILLRITQDGAASMITSASWRGFEQ